MLDKVKGLLSSANYSNIFSILWKFRFLILLILFTMTIYFGFKYIQKLNKNLNDAEEIAKVAVAEHNKVINEYSNINIALTDREQTLKRLEMENAKLKGKIGKVIESKPENVNWGDVNIPFDVIRLLVEQTKGQ